LDNSPDMTIPEQGTQTLLETKYCGLIAMIHLRENRQGLCGAKDKLRRACGVWMEIKVLQELDTTPGDKRIDDNGRKGA
jgi:hypothetical protein